MITCPSCKKKISEQAEACPFCGHPLKEKEAVQKWKPGVAAILSLIVPGAGQIYKGKLLPGFLWLVIVLVGYFFFLVPGIVLHFICIITAFAGDPYK